MCVCYARFRRKRIHLAHRTYTRIASCRRCRRCRRRLCMRTRTQLAHTQFLHQFGYTVNEKISIGQFGLRATLGCEQNPIFPQSRFDLCVKVSFSSARQWKRQHLCFVRKISCVKNRGKSAVANLLCGCAQEFNHQNSPKICVRFVEWISENLFLC